VQDLGIEIGLQGTLQLLPRSRKIAALLGHGGQAFGRIDEAEAEPCADRLRPLPVLVLAELAMPPSSTGASRADSG
jgi:hypothetical protein